MATWGPGNFDNDAAVEFVRDEAIRAVSDISKIYSDEDLLEPDEYESDILFCKIELLIWLLQQGRLSLGDVINGEDLSSRELVGRWKSIYLRIWDEYIDELEPTDEYKVERRSMIEDSFDRILRFAK